MKGEIYLAKLNERKVVPVIIIGLLKEDKLLVCQLKSSTIRYKKNEVYIGKPQGLKSESVVMIYRSYTISSMDIIKYIAKVDIDKVEIIYKEYNEYIQNSNLHKRMHRIKREIALAQLNNQDYKELEIELEGIIKRLGYEVKRNKSNRAYGGYRDVPTKGYIKVYYGGR